MKKTVDVDEGFAAVIFGILALAVGGLAILAVLLLRAVAVWLLWGWFVVTPFGYPALSLFLVYGLLLLLNLVFPINRSGDADGARVIAGIMHPILAIFFGWIAHFLI